MFRAKTSPAGTVGVFRVRCQNFDGPGRRSIARPQTNGHTVHKELIDASEIGLVAKNRKILRRKIYGGAGGMRENPQGVGRRAVRDVQLAIAVAIHDRSAKS